MINFLETQIPKLQGMNGLDLLIFVIVFIAAGIIIEMLAEKRKVNDICQDLYDQEQIKRVKKWEEKN